MTTVTADRIRYLRTLMAFHDVRQAELAKVIGCTQQNLQRKLAGQGMFSADQLLAIAEFFEIDPGLLLRPPPLEGVLGSVRSAAGTLLTCTYRQLCWSEPIFRRVRMSACDSGLVRHAA